MNTELEKYICKDVVDNIIILYLHNTIAIDQLDNIIKNVKKYHEECEKLIKNDDGKYIKRFLGYYFNINNFKDINKYCYYCRKKIDRKSLVRDEIIINDHCKVVNFHQQCKLRQYLDKFYLEYSIMNNIYQVVQEEFEEPKVFYTTNNKDDAKEIWKYYSEKNDDMTIYEYNIETKEQHLEKIRIEEEKIEEDVRKLRLKEKERRKQMNIELFKELQNVDNPKRKMEIVKDLIIYDAIEEIEFTVNGTPFKFNPNLFI